MNDARKHGVLVEEAFCLTFSNLNLKSFAKMPFVSLVLESVW